MEDQDLTQKLEKMSLPAAETPLNQQRLRRLLLQKHVQLNQSPLFLPWLWKTATLLSCSLAVLLLLFSAYSGFIPRDASLAREIALNDPRVKALIEKGAIVNSIDVSGDRASVSVSSRPPRAASPKLALPAADRGAEGLLKIQSPAAPSVSPFPRTVFLVEVDLRKGTVTEIREVEWTK